MFRDSVELKHLPCWGVFCWFKEHNFTFFIAYKVVFKFFETDAVKIVKPTTRPIGHRHPGSTLPHVNTGPTISIFGTLPGSPFLSECQALSAIWPVSPQWYQTGVLSASISHLEIGRSHRVPNQGSTVGGGWQQFCLSPETAGWE